MAYYSEPLHVARASVATIDEIFERATTAMNASQAPASNDAHKAGEAKATVAPLEADESTSSDSDAVQTAPKPAEMDHVFLTPQEVADFLRIDPSTLQGFLASGELRAIRWGEEWRIFVQDVFHFMGERFRKQQLDLLRVWLSDPMALAREFAKDPARRKEIEDSQPVRAHSTPS